MIILSQFNKKNVFNFLITCFRTNTVEYVKQIITLLHTLSYLSLLSKSGWLDTIPG